MKKFFLLSFIPTSPDFGLLVLRVAVGALMLALHGWGKVKNFSSSFDSFPDPLGIGHQASYLLATGGEFVAAACIVLGLATRISAIWLGTVMGVAFFIAHGGALSGQRSGEMALLYMIPCVVLLFTGAGRFSVDAKLGGGGKSTRSTSRA